MKISTSILSCKDRKKAIKELNNTNINYLHIDVMDGKFVDNKQFTIKEIEEISKLSNKKLDIHLMVDNPINYIDKISLLNIEYITIHLEIEKDILSILKKIKSMGFKTGLSIKPNTDISNLIPYLEDIDLILVMSVEPGKGGQEFIFSTLEKVQKIYEIKNVNTIIEMDGGINDNNISIIKLSNVDMVVVGSFITNSNNYQEQIDKLI